MASRRHARSDRLLSASMRHRLSTRLRYLRAGGRLRRRIWLGLGALALLTVGWIVVTALLVKQQAADLQTRLEQVRYLISQGKVPEAEKAARDIPDMAQHAHDLTTGPAWWAVSKIPYLGDPVDNVRSITAAFDVVGSDAVPRLIGVATSIDPTTLRVNGGTIRLDVLKRAQAPLAEATSELDAAYGSVRDLPSTWLSPLDSQVTTFQKQIKVVRGYVTAASRASRVLPIMLGDTSPKKYFIGLQNESEMRGTGGLPGAFTIATASHGKLTFEKFKSDSALIPLPTGAIQTGLNFGADYNAAYAASQPTIAYVDSNVSPHFPYAAQIWAAMWQKVSGEHIDGVLAVDPTCLSYFLDAVGGATLPSGAQITSQNVVSLTQKDAYTLFPNIAERKAFLVAVLKASAQKLISGAGNAISILHAASASASQQRLIAWSRDPVVEKALKETHYASTLPKPSTPVSALVLNNAAAGKLDYYLTRELDYQRIGCGAVRDVIATIKLTNNAPASGLPAYVTDRQDTPPPGARPGDSRTIIDYFASAGAILRGVRVNDQASTAAVLTVNGLSMVRLDLELPRGTEQTIELHLEEPAHTGDPVIWRQPGVIPLTVEEFNQSCG